MNALPCSPSKAASGHLPPTWPPDRLDAIPHTLNDHIDDFARTMPPPEADIIWVRKWVATAADFRYATPRHLVSWTGLNLHHVKVDYMVGYLVECGLGQFHATEIALDIVNARKTLCRWQHALEKPESIPNAKKIAKQTAVPVNENDAKRTTRSRTALLFMRLFIRFADVCVVVSLLCGVLSIFFPLKLKDVLSDYRGLLRPFAFRQ
ncbi:hypothetical protein CkaCkLH20_12245 [Colletotrichum karsti]|uniref:Uncharacterized protein n=1 Tax=Colletotrichum karsti TaxID=1095194 RepID=A0A9P6HWK7_9PEZI|nr:uncharacterized protein CkaCkLH20_12245 [Colletotrichum karsti]KAF9870281.1 hypothetical protein CkaCkLH20_12245 [Colletotrichum karsti]